MYLGKRGKFDWAFALAYGDAISFLFACVVITSLFRNIFPLDDHLWFGETVIYVGLVIAFFGRSHLYTWKTFNSPLLTLIRLLSTFLCVGAVFYFIVVLLNAYHLHYYIWLGMELSLGFLFVWLGRLVTRFILKDILKIIPQERIAFVDWTPRLERVLQSMQKDIGQHQEILGYFSGLRRGKQKNIKNFPYLGALRNLEKVHDQENITLLIVDETTLDPKQLQMMAATCSRLLINFRMIPSAFDILITRLTSRVVAGVPLLGVQGVPLDLYHNRLMKRIVDIIGSIVGLILSAPIILYCMWRIKKESPGPAFYRQVRLGLRGKEFEIIKLRSMRLNAEKKGGVGWTVKNDPRRLQIGNFMRKTNIDETPQFWNVLKGEMSLVGPRPERPEYVGTFSQNIRHYNLRHNCKPGLTSWAAVHGLRGDTSLEDRLVYDLYYFENWSLWLDFKTMFFTLLPPKNAY